MKNHEYFNEKTEKMLYLRYFLNKVSMLFVQIIFIFMVLVLNYTFMKTTEKLKVSIINKYTDWGIDEPDVVDFYLSWVNGSDPNWLQRMKETAYKTQTRFNKDYFKSRYQDNFELKWNLRSIEKYAPWVHKIHFVTDDQYPNWMNLSHPKLHFVNHEYMFYPGFHSYNSHAIQFLLYRIPGISRRVVVIDDDYLFLNNVTPNYFFDELNRTIFHADFLTFDYLNEKMCKDRNSARIFRYGVKLAQESIRSLFKKITPISFGHIHNPIDIKTLLELHNLFDIDSKSFYPFRNVVIINFKHLSTNILYL